MFHLFLALTSRNAQEDDNKSCLQVEGLDSLRAFQSMKDCPDFVDIVALILKAKHMGHRRSEFPDKWLLLISAYYQNAITFLSALNELSLTVPLFLNMSDLILDCPWLAQLQHHPSKEATTI